MRKKIKKEEKILIDLSDRKNIKIIHSVKKQISEKEIQDFEKKLSDRYNNYNEFTEFCIQKNMEKNHGKITQQSFNEAMKSMLEQNTFLKNMITIKEQEN